MGININFYNYFLETAVKIIMLSLSFSWEKNSEIFRSLLKVHESCYGRYVKTLVIDYNPGPVLVLFAQS